MGRWTYYSPLWLGALLVVALNEPLRAMFTLPDGLEWLIVAAVALGFGLQCQVLMIGAQGAFAQVLPVPFGKSIRGGAAVAAGWLLVAWFAFSGAAEFFHLQAVTPGAIVAGILSLATLGGALTIYFWNVPAAVADFGRGP